MRHLAGQQGAKQESRNEGSDSMCMRLGPIMKIDDWLFWPAVYIIEVKVNYQVRGSGKRVWSLKGVGASASVIVPGANLRFERQKAKGKTGGVTQRRLQYRT